MRFFSSGLFALVCVRRFALEKASRRPNPLAPFGFRLIALLMLPAFASAAILRDGTATSAAGGAVAVDTLTFSRTVGVGSGRILIVGVATKSNTAVSSITYGGVSLTLLDTQNNTTNARVELWYLKSPAVGTANVVVTMAAACDFVAGASSFHNVDQSSTFDTVSKATGNSATPSATVASAVGDLVIDIAASSGQTGTPTVGGGQTELWRNTNGTANANTWAGASTEAGASTVTMSWSTTSARWATMGVSMNPGALGPNAAPVNSVPGAQAVDEDDVLVFSAGNGNQIQIADIDAGSGPVQVTFSVTHGTLTLAGTTGLSFSSGDGTTDASMVFTGTLANINTALASITFYPTADYSGSATLTLVSNDQGSTGTGGALSDTDSVSITINSINDAPVAYDDLAGTAPGAPIDVDVRANDLDVDNVSGDLTVSLLTNSPGTSGSVNPDGTINFDPGATTGVQTITYSLTDPDGLPSNVATVTIHVGANSLPTSSDSSATFDEDTTYTFQVSDFSFNDADGAQTLANVRIDTLPASGTLTLAGVAVTAGRTIATADLTNLRFAPAANANGAPYATFTFSVQDSVGGYDASPNTFTLNVGGVNDAPTGADKTITTNEDVFYTFSASDFGFSDIDSGDTISAVRIDALPLAGSLTLSTVPVTASQVITTANIGNLVFTPVGNASGAGYASFTFSVRDQSSVYDASPNTITVNVTAVNDAPTYSGLPATLTVTEDTSSLCDLSSATFADVDSASVTVTLAMTLTSGGAATGQFSLASGSGVTLSANVQPSFSVTGAPADVANYLSTPTNFPYTPASNLNGSGVLTLTISANDNNGFNGSLGTISLDITATNDTPTGTNNTVTTNEDTAYTFSAADFGFNDVDSGDTISAVRIDTIPVAGSLTLSSVAVTATQVITTANIGNLVFTPVGNANGVGYASFTFSVRDQSSTYDTAPNTMTVNVTATNDTPTGTNNTVTTNEDTAYTFSAADFGFNDVDSGDTISAVRIDTIPVAGSLTLSSVAVSANQVITTANISNLVFTPVGDANGASYASFTFSVRDQSSAYDTSPNTMTVNVTATNDTPTGTNNTVTTNEDTAYTFSAADFGFNDVDSGDTISAVRIDTIPVTGSLTLSSVAVSASQVITTANIGNLVFTPAGDANGASYASFTFSVRDQSSAYDTSPNTMTVTSRRRTTHPRARITRSRRTKIPRTRFPPPTSALTTSTAATRSAPCGSIHSQWPGV